MNVQRMSFISYQLKTMEQIVSRIGVLHQIIIWCPPLNQSSAILNENNFYFITWQSKKKIKLYVLNVIKCFTCHFRKVWMVAFAAANGAVVDVVGIEKQY